MILSQELGETIELHTQKKTSDIDKTSMVSKCLWVEMSTTRRVQPVQRDGSSRVSHQKNSQLPA